jgi:hypothetical protein
MKHKALSWLLLMLAAVFCHFYLRYLFGDFQGYLTVPIDGTDYGFAHIKGGTVWVSGRQFTHISWLAPVFALASVVALAFAVRFTYRTTVRGRTNAA